MESRLSLAPKSLIFKEGSPAEKLYIIKAGEVLCLKSSKDRQIPVFLAKAGDIVGESGMLPDLPHAYSAITMDTVEVIEIPAAAFKEILKETPGWLLDLTQTMVGRFQTTSNLIAENRLIHPSVVSEEVFTSSLEVEMKKIINQ